MITIFFFMHPYPYLKSTIVLPILFGNALGWPKWLKSLGTAGTSPFPILFTKLFWKLAKIFKNFGALGCLIAVEEMADFTL